MTDIFPSQLEDWPWKKINRHKKFHGKHVPLTILTFELQYV